MSADRTVFARAVPERISVVETYRCVQQISQRPSSSMAEEPARGDLEVVVPYDGGKHFSRKAIRDVTRGSERLGLVGEDADARIGHLLFDRTERTDLDQILTTANRFGAVPLRVPVSPGEMDPEGFLGHDCRSALFDLAYTPASPEVPPVHVEMELLDADAMRSAWLKRASGRLFADPGTTSEVMKELPSRGGFLLLGVRVRLDLPPEEIEGALQSGAGEEHDLRALARVEIGWPTVPAPESFRLHGVCRRCKEKGLVIQDPVSVPYDPRTRTLQWPLTELRNSRSPQPERALSSLKSHFMFLEIHHGQDLYGEPCLRGRVEVEVEGRLLSGLRLGFFDSLGARRSSSEPIDCRTRVITEFTFDIDDAVRTWSRSPLQQWRFDQVVLEQLRAHDVHKALEDRGFKVEKERLSDPPRETWLVDASRPEGPKPLRLLVYLEGDTISTVRRTEAPGGQTFTTKLRSGCLTAYVRGHLRGAAAPVLHEIHGLHERLRHQFLATTDRR